MNFWETMGLSIWGNDLYIGVAAILELIIGVFSIGFAVATSKNSKPESCYWLSIPYTLFITGITIFPLLGMFGTVKALIELDLSADLADIKQHFFDALTSTAWGILFSVFFKTFNAVFQPFIDKQIDITKDSIGNSMNKEPKFQVKKNKEGIKR